MRKVFAAFVVVCGLAMAQWVDDPLVGNWQMISQKVGNTALKPLPLSIKITQSAGALTFRYVTGREEKLNMMFTVRPDGTAAVIKNTAGEPMGLARLNKVADKYELILQSPGKAPEPGTMTLSNKGQILTCETDVQIPDQGLTHVVQQFSRVVAIPE